MMETHIIQGEFVMSQNPWDIGYLSDTEKTALQFPPENYEEFTSEILPVLSKYPELAALVQLDPAQMANYLQQAKALKEQELELEKQYKLVRDNRLRTDAFLWKDVIALYHAIKGLKGRTDLKTEFKPLFDHFAKRAAKAAQTRRQNQNDGQEKSNE